MKAYVMSRLQGEDLDALVTVQGLLERTGVTVFKQQELKGKPVDTLKAREKMLKEADFVVRVWTDSLPQDDAHALETLKPALDAGKPIITLVFPPIEDEKVPKPLKTHSKYVFFVEDFKSDEEFVHSLKFLERDLGGGFAPEDED